MASEMTTEDVLAVFESAGAVLRGHFILTSGLRSPVFLQKARVFMHPDKNPGDAQASEQFTQISEAYQVRQVHHHHRMGRVSPCGRSL